MPNNRFAVTCLTMKSYWVRETPLIEVFNKPSIGDWYILGRFPMNWRGVAVNPSLDGINHRLRANVVYGFQFVADKFGLPSRSDRLSILIYRDTYRKWAEQP